MPFSNQQPPPDPTAPRGPHGSPSGEPERSISRLQASSSWVTPLVHGARDPVITAAAEKLSPHLPRLAGRWHRARFPAWGGSVPLLWTATRPPPFPSFGELRAPCSPGREGLFCTKGNWCFTGSFYEVFHMVNILIIMPAPAGTLP